MEEKTSRLSKQHPALSYAFPLTPFPVKHLRFQHCSMISGPETCPFAVFSLLPGLERMPGELLTEDTFKPSFPGLPSCPFPLSQESRALSVSFGMEFVQGIYWPPPQLA